jgi:hypothetical protein
MPAVLNNAPLGIDYTDAQTVIFPYPRSAFSVQVYNGAVYYRVGVLGPAGRGIDYEAPEHFTVSSLLNFRDPHLEGFASGSLYAAIMFRSASPTVATQVTCA